jgi:hypothetical protein
VSVEAKKWVSRHPARTAVQQAVLEALAWASQGRGLGARVSYRQIAQDKRLHRNTVLRALKDLERDDRIRRHRGKGKFDGCGCERCEGARRGVAVYDVVMPAEPERAPSGQMNLLAGPSATGTREVPVEVPVAEPVQHSHGATSGTRGVPQGTKGTFEQHHHGGARELVEQVMEILGRVRKPGWYVDQIAIEALVMTWASHKDPLRAAAAVVAAAMDHQHLNAAKLLGRALEWQRLDTPAGPRPRPNGRHGATVDEFQALKTAGGVR